VGSVPLGTADVSHSAPSRVRMGSGRIELPGRAIRPRHPAGAV